MPPCDRWDDNLGGPFDNGIHDLCVTSATYSSPFTRGYRRPRTGGGGERVFLEFKRPSKDRGWMGRLFYCQRQAEHRDGTRNPNPNARAFNSLFVCPVSARVSERRWRNCRPFLCQPRLGEQTLISRCWGSPGSAGMLSKSHCNRWPDSAQTDNMPSTPQVGNFPFPTVSRLSLSDPCPFPCGILCGDKCLVLSDTRSENWEPVTELLACSMQHNRAPVAHGTLWYLMYRSHIR